MKRTLFFPHQLATYHLALELDRRYFVMPEPIAEKKSSRIVHGPQRKGRGGKIKKW